MWSSLALLALPIALDPVRLGFNVLLISRPRPAQNLLVYWVGCAFGGVALLLVPILTLHFTPVFSSFVHDVANPAKPANSTVRHIEILMGALVLIVTTLMAVHFFARQRARLPAPVANASTLVADSDAPNPISRLLSRANNAWESGSLWVALAIGLFAAPNPSLVVFGLATILPSGVAVSTQIGATIVFVVETLTVVEVVLLSNLVAPTKTEALLRRLHDWARVASPAGPGRHADIRRARVSGSRNGRHLSRQRASRWLGRAVRATSREPIAVWVAGAAAHGPRHRRHLAATIGPPIRP
jgi:hypothetical protein